MSVNEISHVYDAVFIVILIMVCIVFTLINLKLSGKLTRKWIFTSASFVAICFITINLWYLTIGFYF